MSRVRNPSVSPNEERSGGDVEISASWVTDKIISSERSRWRRGTGPSSPQPLTKLRPSPSGDFRSSLEFVPSWPSPALPLRYLTQRCTSFWGSSAWRPIALVASRTGRKHRRVEKWSPGRDAAVPGGRTAVRIAHARPLLIDVAKSMLPLGLNELSAKYRTMISLPCSVTSGKERRAQCTERFVLGFSS